MNSNLIREQNILRTMIIIQLKDCRRKLIFQSEPVKSKEKDARTGLDEALKRPLEV